MKKVFNFLKNIKIKLYIFFPILLVLTLFIFSIIPGLNQEIIMPGIISPVENSIKINNTNNIHELYTTAVLVVRKPSVLVSSILSLFPKHEVSEISKVEEKISNTEMQQMGQSDHISSYQNALINGYKQANKKNPLIKLDYKFEYMKVYYSFGNSELKIGDKITSVNNQLLTLDNCENYRLVKSSNLYSTRLGKNVKCDKCVLIPFFTINEEKSYPTLSTNISDSVGGPSGGFMQTLFIYTKLINSNKKNVKVAGTGTIELDGSVGKIGGVIQKIYTVINNNVDIFFIPYDNYIKEKNKIDSIISKTKLKVFPIKNLVEGIEAYEKIA